MYELTKYQKLFRILTAHVEKEKNILKIEMSIQNKGVEKGLRNNLSHVYLYARQNWRTPVSPEACILYRDMLNYWGYWGRDSEKFQFDANLRPKD